MKRKLLPRKTNPHTNPIRVEPNPAPSRNALDDGSHRWKVKSSKPNGLAGEGKLQPEKVDQSKEEKVTWVILKDAKSVESNLRSGQAPRNPRDWRIRS